MTAIIQKELQRFWQFYGKLREARDCGNQAAVRELTDEIDTIRLMTESDKLRARCVAAIEETNDDAQTAGHKA